MVMLIAIVTTMTMMMMVLVICFQGSNVQAVPSRCVVGILY